MTGPNDTTRPISVAELLAKNGTHGAPAPARRRRRRGNSDAVTVAELTGEIPIITDDTDPDAEEHQAPEERPAPEPRAHRANGATRVREEVVEPPAPVEEKPAEKAFWSEPEPRWPASAPPRPREESTAKAREARPQRSAYPRPVRNNVRAESDRPEPRDEKPIDRSGAEGMNPDPLEDYAGMSVDVMDTDVRDAEPAIEDSAYVRSYLRSSTDKGDAESRSSAGFSDIDDVAEADYPDDDADDEHTWSRSDNMRFTGMVVLQSFLAVAFGAGLFIAFDQLWLWNNIVALVLSVLVILGLVIGVRVVRKTEDIGSTLIAVAVGALVTLGPLALLQSR
ncbi:hypothetical protein PT015_21130 [Candidatus Mycobacterium wuenschmannii]|uniref:Transmembrane protein n=1 Tax=Candidatus Mycobacterium wuenschmannii TaxID=3027808 RepID=A0ABY8VWK6_9MYCO|nr:hypothetical protein [Candidatus Mycobacterium wuenschmannii]WIM87321.1 hypothetical protein PT015_21130 [Candidatus Mycobacterium wuenschmannii]